MTPAWYVVQTHPREELRCAEELSRRGITAYCPMAREYRARRRCYEPAPLFPTYLFARFAFSEGYPLLRWARGVKGLVRFGGAAPTLDPDLVDSFLRRTGSDGVVDLGGEFHEGEEVRFRTGPFKDLAGTILRCDSPRGRVMVLLEHLTGQMRVTAEKDQVLAI